MKFFRYRAWPGILVLFCLLAGLIAPAPLPGIEGQAYAAGGPDLVIESITWSPQTPAIGNLMTFTVKVKNQGDDLAGRSRILFFIDNDIADSVFIAQVYPGGAVVSVFNWKAKAGEHIIRVVLDSEETVLETDENNNEKSYALSVLAPDLVIEDVSWTPENPSAGQTVYFSITVKNRGNKSANASSVGFYIDGKLLYYRNINALDIGEEAVVHYSPKASSGSHIVEAVADVLSQVRESNETNNAMTVTCISAAPDLIIQAITWTPTDRSEDERITVSVTVQNTGSGNADFFSLALFVDDIYEASAFIGGLNAGAAVTKTLICTVDGKEHSLKAVADSAGVIDESDKTNNTLTVTVPALAPDLVIQSISWSPAQPLIAHNTIFTITVKNQGVRQSGEYDLDFYISEIYYFHVRGRTLTPGATWSVSFPWVTQTASLSVKAVVDEDNVISESNESNNVATATIGFSRPSPTTDLSIQSLTCNPANPSPGENVDITVLVKNRGPGSASPSYIAYYIDDVFLGSLYVGELDSGATVEKIFKWQAIGGEHQLKVVIDLNDSVFEMSESNNERTISLLTTAPDLIIQGINWFPLIPATGNDVLFTLTVKNQGNRTGGGCYITYYVDGASQGSHYLDEIESGASVTRSFSWKMQSVSHTFRVAVDETNSVAEIDETNNEKTVVLPAPDLMIDSITCSEDYPVADTTLTFNVTILNVGKSPSAGFRGACYIDGSLLTLSEVGGISTGGTAESVFTWTAIAGKHVLRIIADEADAVTESDESNNIKEVIIFVPLPQASSDPAPETPQDVPSEAIPEPEEPVEPVTPLAETIGIPPVQIEEETIPDISDNLSAPPDNASGGLKDMLMNKWLIIVVAAVGVAAIGLLLFLRKRSGQPKASKAPPAPKQTAPPPKNVSPPAPKPSAPPAAPPPAPAAPPPAQATPPPPPQ